VSSPVITHYTKNQNVRTPLLKLLNRLGIPAWPKLFQNLRATRETELIAAGFTRKDVNTWLGNTGVVSMEHYEMALQSSFQKALVSDTNSGCGSTGGSIPDVA